MAAGLVMRIAPIHVGLVTGATPINALVVELLKQYHTQLNRLTVGIVSMVMGLVTGVALTKFVVAVEVPKKSARTTPPVWKPGPLENAYGSKFM